MIYLEYLGWNGAVYIGGSPGRILFFLNIQAGMEQLVYWRFSRKNIIYLEYLGWNSFGGYPWQNNGAKYMGGSPRKILFILNIQVGMEQSLLEVLHEEYYSS